VLNAKAELIYGRESFAALFKVLDQIFDDQL
jgi:hypothetical protein